ncbi:MAG: hypothetical protein ACRDPK_04150 [Carbonactinosporaceae bacterium]
MVSFSERFSNRFRRRGSGRIRSAEPSDEQHLTEFARTRNGVEAFVEPRTAVTETTMVLVAGSGEWTRRRVGGPEAAHALAHRLGIPAYDAGVVGYPQRMREWNRRRAEQERRDEDPRDTP